MIQHSWQGFFDVLFLIFLGVYDNFETRVKQFTMAVTIESDESLDAKEGETLLGNTWSVQNNIF